MINQVSVQTPQGERVGFYLGERAGKQGARVYDVVLWDGHEFDEVHSMRKETQSAPEPLDSAAWLASFGSKPDVTAWVEGAEPSGWQHIIGITARGAQIADPAFSNRVRAVVPFNAIFVGKPPTQIGRPASVSPVPPAGRGVRFDAASKRYIITEDGQDTTKWFSSPEKAQSFARQVRPNSGAHVAAMDGLQAGDQVSITVERAYAGRKTMTGRVITHDGPYILFSGARGGKSIFRRVARSVDGHPRWYLDASGSPTVVDVTVL